MVVDDLQKALPRPDSSEGVPLASVSGKAASAALRALESAIARLDPKAAEKFHGVIQKVEPTAAQALATVLDSIQPLTAGTGQSTLAADEDAARNHVEGHFEGKWFVYTFMATYQDTNSVGNVYFGMYPLYVGKVREMFFRACMPDFDLKTTPFFILTRSFEHKFRLEAREFDKITVRIRVESFNRKFATLEHEIYNEQKQLMGSGRQVLLFVNSSDYQIRDLPNEVKQAFLPHI
jgi:acyl-CoA thioesterase FadM